MSETAAEACDGLSNVTFAVISSAISLAIAWVGYILVGINDKLVKIMSDPRNKLTKQEVRRAGEGRWEGRGGGGGGTERMSAMPPQALGLDIDVPFICCCFCSDHVGTGATAAPGAQMLTPATHPIHLSMRVCIFACTT